MNGRCHCASLCRSDMPTRSLTVSTSRSPSQRKRWRLTTPSLFFTLLLASRCCRIPRLDVVELWAHKVSDSAQCSHENPIM